MTHFHVRFSSISDPVQARTIKLNDLIMFTYKRQAEKTARAQESRSASKNKGIDNVDPLFLGQ
jgi:hypothetical protein